MGPSTLATKDNASYEIDCPFGKLLLPIDIWKCKITGETCPIQASVDPPTFAKLRQYCEANEKIQSGIEKAINSGRYTGFHHATRKYLCPLCPRGAPRNQYHYETSMSGLSEFLDIENRSVRIAFLRSSEELGGYSRAICFNCMTRVAGKLIPLLEAEGVDTTPLRDWLAIKKK